MIFKGLNRLFKGINRLCKGLNRFTFNFPLNPFNPFFSKTPNTKRQTPNPPMQDGRRRANGCQTVFQDDYSQVDILGLLFKSVDFGAANSPGLNPPSSSSLLLLSLELSDTRSL